MHGWFECKFIAFWGGKIYLRSNHRTLRKNKVYTYGEQVFAIDYSSTVLATKISHKHSLYIRFLWVTQTGVKVYLSMVKLKLSGQNLGQVLNCRRGHALELCTSFVTEKLPNLKGKTKPEQLLSSLRLIFTLLNLRQGFHAVNTCRDVIG